MIYSLGLRIGEGTNLQVSDIDSHRMFVHIHRAKGNKDRYIPLPQRTLEILRAFYKMHRNLRYVQQYLGHNDPNTTMVYTRLIKQDLAEPTRILNEVMQNL